MRNKTRNMILTALFTALTAAGAFVKIPLGSVPVTLQTIFTSLAGIILGPILGALSQFLYMAMGIMGIPIFASGGGPSYILKPSFGYLIGFIAGAYVTGKIVEHEKKPGFIRIFTACLLGTLAVYLIGIPYLYFILKMTTNKSIEIFQVLKMGVFIFIPGDLVKCVITAVIGMKIVPIIKNDNLTKNNI